MPNEAVLIAVVAAMMLAFAALQADARRSEREASALFTPKPTPRRREFYADPLCRRRPSPWIDATCAADGGHKRLIRNPAYRGEPEG